MSDRTNVHTVEGRLNLIAKVEDINAGLHQLDLHMANVETELEILRQIVRSVWKQGMSIYDPAIQALVAKVKL